MAIHTSLGDIKSLIFTFPESGFDKRYNGLFHEEVKYHLFC